MAIEDDIAAYEPANEQEEVDKQVIPDFCSITE